LVSMWHAKSDRKTANIIVKNLAVYNAF